MQSFNRPSLRALAGTGGTILDAWRALLRRPDRFVYLDTSTLLSAQSPMSPDFKSRYGHLASTVGSLTPRRDVDQLMTISAVRMILQRVAGEGGVLEQLEGIGDSNDPNVVELRRRADELARLARHLRADVASELLYPSDR